MSTFEMLLLLMLFWLIIAVCYLASVLSIWLKYIGQCIHKEGAYIAQAFNWSKWK